MELPEIKVGRFIVVALQRPTEALRAGEHSAPHPRAPPPAALPLTAAIFGSMRQDGASIPAAKVRRLSLLPLPTPEDPVTPRLDGRSSSAADGSGPYQPRRRHRRKTGWPRAR